MWTKNENKIYFMIFCCIHKPDLKRNCGFFFFFFHIFEMICMCVNVWKFVGTWNIIQYQSLFTFGFDNSSGRSSICVATILIFISSRFVNFFCFFARWIVVFDYDDWSSSHFPFCFQFDWFNCFYFHKARYAVCRYFYLFLNLISKQPIFR